MGDHKNIRNELAAKKIKNLAEEIKTCMFCTYVDNKIQSRPMSVQKIDEEGNLWFLSEKKSNKNQEIDRK